MFSFNIVIPAPFWFISTYYLLYISLYTFTTTYFTFLGMFLVNMVYSWILNQSEKLHLLMDEFNLFTLVVMIIILFVIIHNIYFVFVCVSSLGFSLFFPFFLPSIELIIFCFPFYLLIINIPIISHNKVRTKIFNLYINPIIFFFFNRLAFSVTLSLTLPLVH